MKQKISITIDKEVLGLIENVISSGRFRNRSHVVEYGVKKLMEDKNLKDVRK
jgi:Arc/MetJ-type ribon-helix-helix transcriptional regulator